MSVMGILYLWGMCRGASWIASSPGRNEATSWIFSVSLNPMQVPVQILSPVWKSGEWVGRNLM